MEHLILDYTHVSDVVTDTAISELQPELQQAFQTTLQKTGAGNDFLGWLTLPQDISAELLQAIQRIAADLRQKSRYIVVIGIGGSYLGAKAVIEAMKGPFAAYQPDVQIVFAGQNISAWYLRDLLNLLAGKDFSLIVISKSGTTTEPGLAFRILKETVEKKYGKTDAKTRIVAVTDRAKGALKTLATKEGYTTYEIADDIGGRFSVLTPVGLLPIACAGIDIQAFVAGFRSAAEWLTRETDLHKNPALMYAAIRTILYRQGKQIELLVNFEPALHYVSEWWKQLFGESEGKGGKGLFPASVDFTTDLHSMGQFIQDGRRNLFETFLIIEKSLATVIIPHDAENLDGLNFTAGKNLDEINYTAYQGTAFAHKDGGAPSMTIALPDLTPFYVGQLFYFFEFAVAVSGDLLGVNPFDQPGVEAYKNNMFALLGKPGFEKEGALLKTRIQATESKRIG